MSVNYLLDILREFTEILLNCRLFKNQVVILVTIIGFAIANELYIMKDIVLYAK